MAKDALVKDFAVRNDTKSWHPFLCFAMVHPYPWQNFSVFFIIATAISGTINAVKVCSLKHPLAVLLFVERKCDYCYQSK
jgi:hypothetical protein